MKPYKLRVEFSNGEVWEIDPDVVASDFASLEGGDPGTEYFNEAKRELLVDCEALADWALGATSWKDLRATPIRLVEGGDKDYPLMWYNLEDVQIVMEEE